MADIRLIVRGDDAGSCESADQAIVECCEQGLLRNVSVMVPGPTFASVADSLRDRDATCLGLHVTLNAEWEAVKWGPVLPPARLPSLVDENGHFLPTPGHLHERRASVDEMMAEVEAQWTKARALGLNVTYLDEHMGVGWLPGLGERLAAFAAHEGLFYAATVPGLPLSHEDGSVAARWIAGLRRATSGTYVLVTHPGLDVPDMQAFGGSVARERDAERRTLLDPNLRDTLHGLGVRLVCYTDV